MAPDGPTVTKSVTRIGRSRRVPRAARLGQERGRPSCARIHECIQAQTPKRAGLRRRPERGSTRPLSSSRWGAAGAQSPRLWRNLGHRASPAREGPSWRSSDDLDGSSAVAFVGAEVHVRRRDALVPEEVSDPRDHHPRLLPRGSLDGHAIFQGRVRIKPFDPIELVAHTQALLRRQEERTPPSRDRQASAGRIVADLLPVNARGYLTAKNAPWVLKEAV